MAFSIFTEILEELVRAVPGACGAIFIDWEGESVAEFTVRGETDGIRLVGAHWGVIYFLVKRRLDRSAVGDPAQVLLNFERQQVMIQRVTDDYLLVLSLRVDSNVGRARELAEATTRRLRQEM
jgi:predicted regulator of Ras-like GTPase activity (Roadblock/LC7/MglB family)